MRYILVALALFAQAPVVSATCKNCITAKFGYEDQNRFINNYVDMVGEASNGLGVDSPIKSVYYEFVADNNTYKGTDDVNGVWRRVVSPKVRWGSITFTYRIKVTLESGQSVWLDKVIQRYNR